MNYEPQLKSSLVMDSESKLNHSWVKEYPQLAIRFESRISPEGRIQERVSFGEYENGEFRCLGYTPNSVPLKMTPQEILETEARRFRLMGNNFVLLNGEEVVRTPTRH